LASGRVTGAADLVIRQLDSAELDADLEEIVAVYAAASVEDPAAALRRMRTEVLPRHRRRDGFRFLVGREGAPIVGIAYGYVGARGQWWTERVARSMTAAQQAEWLDRPHFEVVELHVRPDRQRRGIGRRLLETLLEGIDLPFALLSTDEGNESARAFYRQLGWVEIVRGVDLASPRGPYVILARQLATGARSGTP
jgi:ribosomal protein S18 acetylase RimI-like enzyme